MVKGTPDVLEETVQTMCPAVVQWLKGEKVDNTEQLTKVFDEESVRMTTEMIVTFYFRFKFLIFVLFCSLKDVCFLLVWLPI